VILSDDDIQEFTDLYEGEYGERLSKEEASEIAWRLADLYAFLATPLPSEQSALPKPQLAEADSHIPA